MALSSLAPVSFPEVLFFGKRATKEQLATATPFANADREVVLQKTTELNPAHSHSPLSGAAARFSTRPPEERLSRRATFSSSKEEGVVPLQAVESSAETGAGPEAGFPFRSGTPSTKEGDSRALKKSTKQRATVDANAETGVEQGNGESAMEQSCVELSGFPGLTEQSPPTPSEAAPGHPLATATTTTDFRQPKALVFACSSQRPPPPAMTRFMGRPTGGTDSTPMVLSLMRLPPPSTLGRFPVFPGRGGFRRATRGPKGDRGSGGLVGCYGATV